MTTRIVRIATATAALVGLIATGCSSPAANDTAGDAKVPVITGGAATTTTTIAPVTPVVVSTTAPSPAPAPAPAPAPVPTPAPTPAPEPTLGEPPVSVVPPFVILTPIDFSLFMPMVNTLEGATQFSCAYAALLGFSSQIHWSATNTDTVQISINDEVAGGVPAIGTTSIPLICGATQTVKVTALWPDGSPGLSKSIVLKVSAF